MAFKIEEDYSWFDNQELPEISEDRFISNSQNAIDLLSKLLKFNDDRKTVNIKRLHSLVNKVFSINSNINLDNELEYYSQFIILMNRLIEQQKNIALTNHSVIGIGGKFSSGKSKFINTIAGLNGLLPENTTPTTSIPTYIINSSQNYYKANNKYGATSTLDIDRIQALTHEFYEEYGIGFSSFVESIIIGSEDWLLPKNIALLDTPGYNKFDNKSKESVSDKMKAYQQLRITDHLIWLVDVDNGTITNDDIAFIESLNITEPVLIVFNKCERKSISELEEIVAQAYYTIKEEGLNCYGISAYSARTGEEYTCKKIIGDKCSILIDDFIKHVSDCKSYSNNIYDQIIKLEKEYLSQISYRMNSLDKSSSEIEELIRKSNKVIDIHSLANIWSLNSKERSTLFYNKEKCENYFDTINSLVSSYLGRDH